MARVECGSNDSCEVIDAGQFYRLLETPNRFKILETDNPDPNQNGDPKTTIEARGIVVQGPRSGKEQPDPVSELSPHNSDDAVTGEFEYCPKVKRAFERIIQSSSAVKEKTREPVLGVEENYRDRETGISEAVCGEPDSWNFQTVVRRLGQTRLCPTGTDWGKAILKVYC